MVLKITVFRDVTPYNLAEFYYSFGEKGCIRVQGSNPEYIAPQLFAQEWSLSTDSCETCQYLTFHDIRNNSRPDTKHASYSGKCMWRSSRVLELKNYYFRRNTKTVFYCKLLYVTVSYKGNFKTVKLGCNR